MSRKTTISIVIIILIITVGLVWFSLRSGSSFPTIQFGSFGTSTNNTSGNNSLFLGNTSSQASGENSSGGTAQIFNISPGPVTSAIFIQTTNPTTTIVRFVMQDNGHVFDTPLGVIGNTAHPVSVTTVPGAERVLWLQAGSAMILQYLDNTQTIKTIYLKFSSQIGSSTLSGPVEINFFPDNIISIAPSPDGNNVVYLLKSQVGGASGYIAQANGSQPKKLFSEPLVNVLISWPSPAFLLLQSKSAADVPGIVFEIGAKSGAMIPLLYGQGLTALANSNFNAVIYQTRFAGTMQSYVHNLATGEDSELSLNPSPERCVFDPVITSTLYCVNPNSLVNDNYLDLWHQGLVSSPDRILFYNLSTGGVGTIATPGSSDGGIPADIAQLMISPDDQYLMYITKGDRSLWGVHLTP